MTTLSKHSHVYCVEILNSMGAFSESEGDITCPPCPPKIDAHACPQVAIDKCIINNSLILSNTYIQNVQCQTVK